MSHCHYTASPKKQRHCKVYPTNALYQTRREFSLSASCKTIKKPKTAAQSLFTHHGAFIIQEE